MPDQLKHFFDKAVVARIAAMIADVHPSFSRRRFETRATRGIADLELLARGWHIADALHKHLPPDYAEAAAILKASLGPPLERTEGNGIAPFLYLPHVFFVAKYGLEDLETSLDLQYELTQRFSAEFSIRAFIERYPAQTMARLHTWTRDPSRHVRRLVSEGTRPRLPWAQRLPEFQRDPSPVIALLEQLRDDPDLYVRRSVANNLNDIGKDNPRALYDTCARWLVDATPEREWLVRHALRSAIKRAEPDALRLLGHGRAPEVRIANVTITPKRPHIGDAVRLTFDVVSTSARAQSLMVDLRIHFVKADGSTKPRVFKLAAVELPPRSRTELRTRISLRQMTTRTHHPGAHRAEAVVNGVTLDVGRFTVQ